MYRSYRSFKIGQLYKKKMSQLSKNIPADKIPDTPVSQISRITRSTESVLESTNRKSHRCLKVIKLINILLIIIHFLSVIVGYHLLSTYMMDKLYHTNSDILSQFWPFYYFPWSLVAVSLGSICICIVGYKTISSRSKPFLFTNAILMIVLPLLTFGCLISCFEMERILVNGITRGASGDVRNEFIKLFHQKQDFRSSWNDLQQRFLCCGAFSYEDYVNTTTREMSYPKSCEVRYINSRNCKNEVIFLDIAVLIIFIKKG